MLSVVPPTLLRCCVIVMLMVGSWARGQQLPPAMAPSLPPAFPAPTATPSPTPTPHVLNGDQAAVVHFGAPGFHLTTEPATPQIGTLVTLTLAAREAGFDFGRVRELRMDPDENDWQVDANWRRDWQAKAGDRMGPWHARLRPFATGTVALPPITIVYTLTNGVTTETQLSGLALQVASVLPPGATSENPGELVPLRDPAELPLDWTPLWITLAAMIAFVVLALLARRWWLRRGQGVQAPAAPQLPPGRWALEELDRRSRLPVCQTGPAKLVYSHASEVIRIYLGRRFGIQAIDMTTMECLRALRQLREESRPGEDALRWIDGFLEECDLVKFTTHEPVREQWPTAWNNARLIVTITTPAEELEPGAAAPLPAEASAP